MVSRGAGMLSIAELDLRQLDEQKLEEYAKKFPRYVDKLVEKVRPNIGTTPVTNENKERIHWNKKAKNEYWLNLSFQ